MEEIVTIRVLREKGAKKTEIARQLGISQMQVSRLLRKTLKILRENLVREGSS